MGLFAVECWGEPCTPGLGLRGCGVEALGQNSDTLCSKISTVPEPSLLHDFAVLLCGWASQLEPPVVPALQVTVGDMATTRVPGRFSLVYLLFNTIGNLRTHPAAA
jgi:hypothetical protein